MYMDYIGLLDVSNAEDKKLDEDLMKERDFHLMQCDKAISICKATQKKLGRYKRESLNASFSSPSGQSSAQLRKINVPTFDGDLWKFIDFKALFENIVHNDDSIPTSQQDALPKGSINWRCRHHVTQHPPNRGGYKEGWYHVIQKYDNRQ